jgi:hypothetical protein
LDHIPSLPFLASRQNLFYPLIQRENIRDNKKDIAFSYLEIEIAIQRDYYS